MPTPRSRLVPVILVSLLAISGIGGGAYLATSRAGVSQAGPVAELEALPSFLPWGTEAPRVGRTIVELRPAVPSDSRRLVVEDGHLTLGVPDAERPGDLDDIRAALGDVGGPESLDAAIAALAAQPGVTEVRPLVADYFVVTGDATPAELAALDFVQTAFADIPVLGATADDFFPLQWPLENRGGVDGWSLRSGADAGIVHAWHRTRGDGVVVAVVDSGADISHPDLQDSVWTNPGETCGNGIDDEGNGYIDDCHGWDFEAGDSTVEDRNGHGTHVAGIIGANAGNGIGVAGVAPDARLMIVKIGDGAPTLSAAIEGLRYAVRNGAQVVNVSWIAEGDAAAAILAPVLAEAEAAGVLVVAGAGNLASDIDRSPVFPAASPHDNVLTVGASTGADLPAGFSSYGAQSVDVFAPGQHIVSTVPGGYAVYSGTSMAAPFVSGAAALLWSATPRASLAEVKGAIMDRSDGPNDGVSGFRGMAASDGRLNAGRAIYTRLFAPALSFTFVGLDGVIPDTQSAITVRARAIDPWEDAPQVDVRFRARLFAAGPSSPLAVSGVDIVSDELGVVTTGPDGSAWVSSVFRRSERPWIVQQGAETVELGLNLPAGTYALVMELVDVSGPPVVLAEPAAAFFLVGVDGTIRRLPAPAGTNTPPPTPTTTPPPVADDPPADPPAPATTVATTVPVATTVAVGSPQAPPSTAVGPVDTVASPQPPGATTSTIATSPSPIAQPPVTGTEPASDPGTGGSGTSAPSSTTTSPVPGAGGTDDTASVEPGPGGFRISGLNPSEGPSIGGTTVAIVGDDLPERPLVDFGGSIATVVAASSEYVIVVTGASAPGTVDVTVSSRDGRLVATLPGAFTYLAPPGQGSGPAPTTTQAAAASPIGSTPDTVPTTTSTLATPSTTSTPPPSSTTTGPSTDSPGVAPATPGNPTPLPPSPTTTVEVAPPDEPVTAPGGTVVPLDDWLRDVLVPPTGLDLRDPGGGAPGTLRDWAGALCTAPECPGWVLRS